MKHSSLANRIDHTREEEETAATPLLRAALVALSVRAGISLLNSVSQRAHVVFSFSGIGASDAHLHSLVM